MKSLLILLLSLMNISFAKTIIRPTNKKRSFANEIMKKSSSSETDSIRSQDCVSGGGGGR